MEEEKKEHELKMKKMEHDMEQVFENKVSEKMQKLRDSEAEVSFPSLPKLLVSNFLFLVFSCKRDMIRLQRCWSNRGWRSRKEERCLRRKEQHLKWLHERWKTIDGHQRLTPESKYWCLPYIWLLYLWHESLSRITSMHVVSHSMTPFVMICSPHV